MRRSKARRIGPQLKSPAAVIRDYARRTADEWHQWVVTERPEEAEDGKVGRTVWVNNRYGVERWDGEYSLIVTRHVGWPLASELQRIVDELIAPGAAFAVDGRITGGRTAVLYVAPVEKAELEAKDDE